MRADLLRLSRWPAAWAMLGVWLLLNGLFSFLFPYLSYRSGASGFSTEGVSRAQLLSSMLPAQLPVTLVSGTPMFGGAILLILGALAAGSGYSWGTWKTVLTQGRTRLQVVRGLFQALAVAVVAFVVLTVVFDLALSLVVAWSEGQAATLPGGRALLEAFGATLLICAVWTSGGVFIGLLARGPALAVGLGLVWALAVENLLRGVAGPLDWLRPVTDHLPGSAAGSLAAAVGAAPAGGPDGTPGVVTSLTGSAAVLTAALYLVAFVALAATLLRRRDVT
ncbi:ABC transporter permease [Actinoplanes sp. NPDC051343]|uniref:ABC transporter permease n=1 Tax=Actinoplanes sp. NPDC051343 TaxID=3363906 RepID=UPI0037A96255